VVLLVGQGLDRGRVEALAAQAGAVRAQREVHGELTDHRLAGAGRGADQHATAALEGLAGLALEVVEVETDIEHEIVEGRELGGAGRPALRSRIPFGGAHITGGARHEHKANACL
jgi:hypothetical protein